ncbi:MAG: hypothetical protein LKJ17_06760 [Oscillospiraceae bacterium]|nr:hypothetical protein [Oscillospiraceae bacterium]
MCKVKDITSQALDGESQKQPFYVLQPLYENCTIFVPAHSTKIFMRPIISKEEAKELIDSIPTIQAEVFQSRSLQKLTEHYKALLSTHNCSDLIRLCLSIYEKKDLEEQQKHKLGVLDEKYLKHAEELLFGELAAALDIPKDDMSEYLAEKVSKEQKNIDP